MYIWHVAFSGNCRWSSDCAGSTQDNLCPGPSEFKCCNTTGLGFGGYEKPNMDLGSGCKDVAKQGANLTVEAFPKRIREIGCTRTCGPGETSDHCDGMATDMMCSDAGGVCP
jgi:hypothetical protein